MMTVAAIVLSHDPDTGLLERLRGVRQQVDQLFIVDNASNEQNLVTVREAASALCATLIENRENTGVAAGFNQGAAAALQSGCDFVLLLDQDTLASPRMVSRLLGLFMEQTGSGVAVLAANYTDTGQRTAYRPEAARPVSESAVAISSGSLIPASAYADLGGMDEQLFIDDVDHDFCLRARSRGYRVLVTAEPLMRHQVGKQRIHRILGMSFSTSAHSPLRRYYMARNRIILVRRYFTRFPAWILTMLLRQTAEITATLVLEAGRARKLRALFLGIKHGLDGRTGSLTPPAWMASS